MFGLNLEIFGQVSEWVSERFDKSILWPNVIINIETAQEFIRLFLGSSTNIKLIELGLNSNMMDQFFQKAEPTLLLD